MIRKRFPLACALLLCAASLCGTFVARAAGDPAAGAAALADSLRLDPAVRCGVLPNGLRYLVRRNGKPEARVALRLVVSAGSTAEADDQRGFAHFCEHMSFNGSAHFKPEELVAYLQSIGLRFGADANAYTSFTETVYMLEVPTDRDTLLDRGLTALQDFAGGATMSEAEIDKERGVVLEEWRRGRGAGERMQRRQFPVLYHGSRYAERLPIGQPEIIEKGSSARLRDFYRDWYTPDHMTVIAVGDIDPARMDSLIRARFAGLPAAASRRPSPRPDMPPHAETLVSVATDREATGSQVSVTYKRPREEVRTAGDFRRSLVKLLYSMMLNARLGEIAQRSDAPFLSARAGLSGLGRTTQAWRLGARVPDGGIERGLTALLQEAERVRRHGFLQVELERARDQVRAWDESRYAERDKSESDGFAGEYVQYALDGEPVPGIDATHRLTRALLDGITLAEIDALTPDLMREGNRVVLASAPDKPGVAPPSEESLRALLAAPQAPPAAWADSTSGRLLMSTAPPPGRVASRRRIDELGVTVVTLSNGLEVWLKPTDLKADEIQISGYARGGLSVADSTEFPLLSRTSRVLAEAGVGGHTATELGKLLAGRLAWAHTYINPYTQSFASNTRPADLETALQLLYLGFTQPTRDTSAFAAFLKRTRSELVDRANSPEAAFADTVASVNGGGFYMNRPVTVSDLDRMRLDPMLRFHRERFANASDFTAFMVGTFHVDSVLPVLARTLGALPGTGHRTSDFVPRGPRFPEGVRTVRVYRGVEPKSSVQITFFTHHGFEELELHRANSCASILTDRLRERLREMLGGTYVVTAGIGTYAPLPGFSTLSISFGCAPARVDTLVAAALAEVRRLCDEGPTAADLQKEQEIQRRELEVSLKDNGFWIGALQVSHQLGRDPLRLAKRRERIGLLTTDNLRATFREWLPPDHYSVVMLMPEPAPAGKGADR